MIKLVELAIGLVLAFTLVSLAAAAVHEWISAMFAFRGKALFRGIQMLIGDKDGETLWGHPLIRGISVASWKRWERHPAYVPAETFVQALLATVGGTHNTFDETRRTIAALPDNDLKKSLLALLQDAEGDLGRFKAKVAGWFDAGMDAVSGLYKRRTQAWLFGIGLLISLLVGIDSVHVARALWSDDALRTIVVAEGALIAKGDSVCDDGRPTGSPGAAAPAEASSAELDVLRSRMECARERIDTIAGTALPLVPMISGIAEDGTGYACHLPGILLTAFAACFGAPFWFDLLNKLVNLRLAEAPKPDPRTGKQ